MSHKQAMEILAVLERSVGDRAGGSQTDFLYLRAKRAHDAFKRFLLPEGWSLSK